jgi:hypothetical protein
VLRKWQRRRLDLSDCFAVPERNRDERADAHRGSHGHSQHLFAASSSRTTKTSNKVWLLARQCRLALLCHLGVFVPLTVGANDHVATPKVDLVAPRALAPTLGGHRRTGSRTGTAYGKPPTMTVALSGMKPLDYLQRPPCASPTQTGGHSLASASRFSTRANCRVGSRCPPRYAFREDHIGGCRCRFSPRGAVGIAGTPLLVHSCGAVLVAELTVVLILAAPHVPSLPSPQLCGVSPSRSPCSEASFEQPGEGR